MKYSLAFIIILNLYIPSLVKGVEWDKKSKELIETYKLENVITQLLMFGEEEIKKQINPIAIKGYTGKKTFYFIIAKHDTCYTISYEDNINSHSLEKYTPIDDIYIEVTAFNNCKHNVSFTKIVNSELCFIKKVDKQQKRTLKRLPLCKRNENTRGIIAFLNEKDVLSKLMEFSSNPFRTLLINR